MPDCILCKVNKAEVFITRNNLAYSQNIISGRTVLAGDLLCKKCLYGRYTMSGPETIMMITDFKDLY